MRHSTRWIYRAAVIGGGVLLMGCATDPSGPQMSDRQDQALKHPFDYSTGQDIPDISGGGIGDLDRKSLGKDLNDVFNP